jgi:hypothetical protein
MHPRNGPNRATKAPFIDLNRAAETPAAKGLHLPRPNRGHYPLRSDQAPLGELTGASGGLAVAPAVAVGKVTLEEIRFEFVGSVGVLPVQGLFQRSLGLDLGFHRASWYFLT